MTIVYKPTAGGGRLAYGNTEFGEYEVRWNSDGTLLSQNTSFSGNGRSRCVHLTKFIETRPTESGCGCGSTEAEVWGCAIHKTCTFQWNVEPVAGQICSKCPNMRGENATPIVLSSHLAPGDILMMTAAVRDLATAYPGKYNIHVATTCKELWDNNPYVTHVADLDDNEDEAYRRYELHYPSINRSDELPYHFIHGYRKDLQRQLGVPVPQGPFRGDIHLSDKEKVWMNQVEQVFGWKGPFWIIVSGCKHDYTAKLWNPDYAQKVVDHFRGKIQFVQCGESGHHHPPLDGVLNLVGKTNLREFIRLIHHSSGVLCPVTFAMHAAAAVPTKDGSLRPCVVLAGGREPVHWESYPGHQFLHTIGALPCCAKGGCWKSRCQKMNDGDKKDTENLCERPVYHGDGKWATAQCMEMIRPGAVIDAIERYC